MAQNFRGITIGERRDLVDQEPSFSVRFIEGTRLVDERLIVQSRMWGRVRYLGGAEGYVFRATRERDGKSFILKLFIQPVIEREPEARWNRTRHLCEADLSSLSPPDAATVFLGAPVEMVVDTFGFSGSPLIGIVMELAPGRQWKQLKSDENTSMSARTRILLSRQVALACQKLEVERLAHCDLSDTNVLIDLQKTGLALIDYDLYWSTKIENLGIHEGNPGPGRDGYLAPTATNPAGPFYDRFALAIMIWEFLAWEDWGKDDEELHMVSQVQIESQRPPDLSRIQSRYSPEAANYITRTLLAKRPEERPSPAEWIEILDALLLKPVNKVEVYEKNLARPELLLATCSKLDQLSRWDARMVVAWKWDKNGFQVRLTRAKDKARCFLRDAKGSLVALSTDKWTPIHGGFTLSEPRLVLRFLD